MEVLPRYLGSSLEPAGDDPWDAPRPRRRSSFGILLKAEEYILKTPRSELLFERQGLRHGLQRGPGPRTPCEDGWGEDVEPGLWVSWVAWAWRAMDTLVAQGAEQQEWGPARDSGTAPLGQAEGAHLAQLPDLIEAQRPWGTAGSLRLTASPAPGMLR